MFPTNTVVTGASGSEIVAGLGGALKVASATTDAGAGADRGGGGSIPGSRGYKSNKYSNRELSMTGTTTS
jgi:hypothetical protein